MRVSSTCDAKDDVVPRGGGPSVTRLIQNGAKHICNTLVSLLAAVGKVPLTCGGSVRRSGRLSFSTVSAAGNYVTLFANVLSAVGFGGSIVEGDTTRNFAGTASTTSCLMGRKIPFHSTRKVVKHVILCYLSGRVPVSSVDLRRLGRFSPMFRRSICSTVSVRAYIGGHLAVNTPKSRTVGGIVTVRRTCLRGG